MYIYSQAHRIQLIFIYLITVSMIFTPYSPFQEGNGSSAADRLLAGTSGNGGSVLDESLTGRPSSTGGAGDDSSVSSIGDNTRLRKLLSHGESGGGDNPNKILKDLLNQKDEDDTHGGVAGGGGDGNSTLERLMSRVPSHHDFKPNSSSSPAVNSTANNMLREVSIQVSYVNIINYAGEWLHVIYFGK